MLWKKFAVFRRSFGDGDNKGGGQFFKFQFWYSNRVLSPQQNLQVSYGVIGKKFFVNLNWSSRSWRLAKFYELFPLRKLSFIMDLVSFLNSPILNQFPSFFLLDPCHLVLIYVSIESCLISTMLIWHSFFCLKINSKSLGNFVDLLQKNYTFLRADILSWETPAYAASNAENRILIHS